MRSHTRRSVATLFVCLPTVLGPAAAADDLCGATIFENLKLDPDLICAGNRLVALRQCDCSNCSC